MKKYLSILLAVLMAMSLLAGCASSKDAADTLEQAGIENAGDALDAAEDALSEAASGKTASDFYSAYAEAKTALLNKLVDALGSNADTAMASLSFLGISFAELYMLPASYFGLGEDAVTNALALLGSKGVTYTEDGNTYTVSYLDSNDQPCEFSGTYDPSGSLVCVGSTNGTENIFSEARRTSYGYAGQFYLVSDDGSTALYQFAIDGADGNGTIGIADSTDRPSALTGDESADFPTGCAEWYSIYGTAVTGVTSDGKTVSFEYVPTDDAE
mgnify:CR=1 FL=1